MQPTRHFNSFDSGYPAIAETRFFCNCVLESSYCNKAPFLRTNALLSKRKVQGVLMSPSLMMKISEGREDGSSSLHDAIKQVGF